MLEVRDLRVYIGGSNILRGISFDVAPGELVCMVGRNGAGKTTALRTIMAFRSPKAGSVRFKGEDITGLRPFEIARRGIGFGPEESEVFGELTVAENIAMPPWTVADGRAAEQRIAEAYEVFPNLRRYAKRGGQALSGGE